MTRKFFSAVSAFTLIAGFAAAPASAATPYDGKWAVSIVTQSGTCDMYRYDLKIENGVVSYAGDGSFDIKGKVGGGGAVTVSIQRGANMASGSGKLGGSSGAGKWTGKSSTSQCSGRWEAQRL